MKVRLGYIGSPTTLEGYTYSKTITYTNFQKLQENEKLLSITKENLEHLKKNTSIQFISQNYIL